MLRRPFGKHTKEAAESGEHSDEREEKGVFKNEIHKRDARGPQKEGFLRRENRCHYSYCFCYVNFLHPGI